MGLFRTLFGPKHGGDARFLTEEAHARKRAGQLENVPKILVELRKLGVTDERRLRLEYFFYTNTKGKAAALSQALADLGFTGTSRRSAGDRQQFVVTGWTSPIKMDSQTVLDWAVRMCDVGYEHDSEFDGWGTNPNQ